MAENENFDRVMKIEDTEEFVTLFNEISEYKYNDLVYEVNTDALAILKYKLGHHGFDHDIILLELASAIRDRVPR